MVTKDQFYYDVRKALDDKGMHMKDLASALKISPQHLSSILLHKHRFRSRLKHIPKIAEYCGINYLPEDVARYRSSELSSSKKK